MTFIAEQVSHHPPSKHLEMADSKHNLSLSLSLTVSSFYAECPAKHMYANGSIHTKSKFLGLSLATYLVGKSKYIKYYNNNNQ